MISHFNNTFTAPAVPTDPCKQSPCGPNSQCRVINEQAVCSCLPGYIGASPNCRPECSVSSQCPTNKACFNRKCADPCPGTCGLNSRCETINHSPICSCTPGYTGDPFTVCSELPSKYSMILTVYNKYGSRSWIKIEKKKVFQSSKNIFHLTSEKLQCFHVQIIEFGEKTSCRVLYDFENDGKLLICSSFPTNNSTPLRYNYLIEIYLNKIEENLKKMIIWKALSNLNEYLQ